VDKKLSGNFNKMGYIEASGKNEYLVKKYKYLTLILRLNYSACKYSVE
jgi:hypothetical protein